MGDPMLVINTIAIPVAVPQASEEIVYRGKAVRAFDNTLRSQVDPTGKREWEVTTPPMTPAWYLALVTAAPHGKRATVSGLMIGGGATVGGPITAVVEYVSASYGKGNPLFRAGPITRVVTLRVREV